MLMDERRERPASFAGDSHFVRLPRLLYPPMKRLYGSITNGQKEGKAAPTVLTVV
jgi:hypothetical protein